MEHPPWSPNLAPYGFLLSGYMKEQLKGRSSAADEGLLSVVSELMRENLPDIILRVFADWDRRPRFCRLLTGEYVE
jgi:hypothetical protein